MTPLVRSSGELEVGSGSTLALNGREPLDRVVKALHQID